MKGIALEDIKRDASGQIMTENNEKITVVADGNIRKYHDVFITSINGKMLAVEVRPLMLRRCEKER
jgi:archaellum component FlaG (FlaF/FlaG flagellin family)